MIDTCELAIIGAGPAGLSAASSAAELGIDVALFDEQAAPGGQVYRSIESASDRRQEILGQDYRYGKKIIKRFRQSNVQYFPNTTVWSINKNNQLGVLHQGQASFVKAKRILIAIGAYERPVPFPGWTLPGVMSAGGGQILFKGDGLLPTGKVVLAGTGPLLLLIAWQYHQAGIKVEAILDCAPIQDRFFAPFKIPQALAASGYLSKGFKMHWQLLKAGISFSHGVKNLQAFGENKLSRLHYTNIIGQKKILHCDHLFVHFGLIPNTFFTRLLGCHHYWDKQQICWRPKTDSWGNTSSGKVAVCGDSAGIHGALSAEYSGQLVALNIAFSLGRINQAIRDERARPFLTAKIKDHRIRPFLETMFSPPMKMLSNPSDETIICRCEEVTAGKIRETIRHGHHGANQVKSLSRCGMGMCQGRQCDHAITHILAKELGQSIEEIAFFRTRPPIKPITIEQLSQLSVKSHD